MNIRKASQPQDFSGWTVTTKRREMSNPAAVTYLVKKKKKIKKIDVLKNFFYPTKQMKSK